MNKHLERLKMGVAVFYYSAKNQLLKEETMVASAAVGLAHGLKYRGSLKQGLKAGAAVMLTISTISGIINVVEHIEKIKSYEPESK